MARARRERLSRRAAEQRDERTAVHVCAHSITPSAIVSSVGGTLSPSAAAVLRLIANSNLEATKSPDLPVVQPTKFELLIESQDRLVPTR